MIRIITSKRLGMLRAEAALVPALRSAAEQADRARREADAARLAAEASAAAADAARQQAEADRDAALASTQREPAPMPAGAPAADAAGRPADTRPTAGLSRREIVHGHLDRVLAVPAPANHNDHLHDLNRDRDAAFRQLDQVRILQLLFGRNEVAAAYCQWLDEALREQAKTAVPLRSWDEVAIDCTPVGWGNRDVHGFRCVCCGDCDWQLVLADDFPDRLCLRCVRRELNLDPGQVWAPRLPPAHGHIAYPGLLPGEPHENTIEVKLTDGTTRRYGLGDASPFLVRSDWGDGLDLTAVGSLSGEADRPRMEVTGSTAREGHQFSFIVTLDFDPAPQGTRQAPYGFRYTSGALTSHGETCAITDPVDLLDTISCSEDALHAHHTLTQRHPIGLP